jgi:hypothetical protein
VAAGLAADGLVDAAPLADGVEPDGGVVSGCVPPASMLGAGLACGVSLDTSGGLTS